MGVVGPETEEPKVSAYGDDPKGGHLDAGGVRYDSPPHALCLFVGGALRHSHGSVGFSPDRLMSGPGFRPAAEQLALVAKRVNRGG